MGTPKIPHSEIIGKKYHMLTAIEHVENFKGNSSSSSYWIFECECGKTVTRSINRVRPGYTQSCGCLRVEAMRLAGKRTCQRNINRFWTRKIIVGECWLWTGPMNGDGYGKVCYNYKRLSAHRLSYILTHGQIQDSLSVCHTCDTPLCFNPDHLFLGTQKDNMRDCASKGRNARGEKASTAKLTKDDVLNIRDSLKNGVSPSVLIDKYGVTNSTISSIKHNRIWKHLSSKPTENTYEQS